MLNILSYLRKVNGICFSLPFSGVVGYSKALRSVSGRVCGPTFSSFFPSASSGVSRSTAENYRTAVRSFFLFNGGNDLLLSSLSSETVRCYERWLQVRGVCPNTSSCYLRSLRALYNKAVGKFGITDKEPFKDVFTGNENTVKRSVGMKEIRKMFLSSSSLPGMSGKDEASSLALDLFLFSFCAMGMPFVDLAHLRRSQIKDGVLSYRRRKTGRQVMTKAGRVTDANMYGEMSVTAFIYPAADSWPSAYTAGSPSAQIYMNNIKVREDRSWSTDYHWPGAGRRVSFFASAPYTLSGLTAFNGGTAGTPPFLSYTVPAGVQDQKDLLVAAAIDRPGSGSVAEPLTMKHALTAVRFVTGDDMQPGMVTKITLKNVYGKGKLPLQATQQWYDLDTPVTFEQTFPYPGAVAPSPQVPGTPLTPEEATFMMLPQTLQTGAKIELEYTDKLTNHTSTLSANIGGSVWPMGKTVTYRVSTSNSITVTPTLEVVAPADFPYNGSTMGYTVKSNATVVRTGAPTKTVPVPWTVEYSTDNGVSRLQNKPDWLSTFTGSGQGGTTVSYNATVAAQTPITENIGNSTLAAAPPVNDGSSAYDLSTKGGNAQRRTANCYIVNAPGRYRLPLVYGNAVDFVKEPVTGKNISAYTSTASGSNVLSPFINHTGAGITDPYIYNNGLTAHSCEIVWQDEQNLVTNVTLSADKHFLEFTVAQETIKQGNAVVAVK